MGRPRKDGRTLREHLESVARQTGFAPAALESDAQLPNEVDYLWFWFCRLSGRRQAGMALCPISWPQIESFFRLMEIVPDEWELTALELLDNAWLEAVANEQAKKD